ncbi:MAG: NADH-quinone oxidoreductase subunit N [Candidatus Aminicenantes bacterium]|nr:NADH-quinone oxidoreductase subunit N [Candidatus Aminicenantes bacterium]
MTTFMALAPLLTVVFGALVVLLLEAFMKRANREPLGYVAALALLAAGFFVIRSWNRDLDYFGGRLVLDRFSLLLIALFVILGLFVLLMGLKYAARQGMNLGEFCGLVLLAVAGLMIMVSSTDWLVVFLGLEVLSVASYALSGLKKTDRTSSEAAAKYFLMGSFAGAFFVFGLALVFGTSGSLDFSTLLAGGVSGAGLAPAGAVGLGLILAALSFKIAIAPFHMWAPDVYEGAPTPVTVFLTVGPKAAGLAVLFRLLVPLLRNEPFAAVFGSALSLMAVLTMFAGNLAALRQRSVKRMLAYSSIAHSGYLIVAVIAGDGPSLVFYLVVYLFMNAGAFSVLAAMSRKGVEYTALDDFAGLGRRYPWLAACLSVFLLSLAGFPPTAGFLAKFYVFSGAVREGHVALAVAAVLASLISVAYYLKVIVFMYMKEDQGEAAIDQENPALYLVIFLCLFGVVQLGLWPGNLLALIRQALSAAF